MFPFIPAGSEPSARPVGVTHALLALCAPRLLKAPACPWGLWSSPWPTVLTLDPGSRGLEEGRHTL